MKKFFDSASKFLLSLFAVLGTVLGFIFIFRKSDSAALLEDDALADSESDLDDRIEELENQDIDDHSNPNTFWDDKL